MYKSNQKRLHSYVSERKGEERHAANQQKRLDKFNAERLGLDEQAQQYATIVSKVASKLSVPVKPDNVESVASLVKKFLARKTVTKFEERLQQNLKNAKFVGKFHKALCDFIAANPHATMMEQRERAYQLLGGKEAKLALEN